MTHPLFPPFPSQHQRRSPDMNSLLLGSTSCPMVGPLNQRSSTSQKHRQGSQRTDFYRHTPVLILGHRRKGFLLQSPRHSLALICHAGFDVISWGTLRTRCHRTVIEDAGASNAVLRAGLAPPVEVTVDKSCSAVSAVYGKNWGRHSWGQHCVLAAVAIVGTKHADPQGYVGGAPWLVQLKVDESSKIAVGTAGKTAFGEGAGIPAAVGALLSCHKNNQR